MSPVYKNGCYKYVVQNYRSISLTSNICKKRCENSNVTNKTKHGIKSKHSTTSTSIEMPNNMT